VSTATSRGLCPAADAHLHNRLIADSPAGFIQPETAAGYRDPNGVGAAGCGDSFYFCRQPASRGRSVNSEGRTSARQAVPVIPGLLEAGQDDTGSGGNAG